MQQQSFRNAFDFHGLQACELCICAASLMSSEKHFGTGDHYQLLERIDPALYKSRKLQPHWNHNAA